MAAEVETRKQRIGSAIQLLAAPFYRIATVMSRNATPEPRRIDALLAPLRDRLTDFNTVSFKGQAQPLRRALAGRLAAGDVDMIAVFPRVVRGADDPVVGRVRLISVETLESPSGSGAQPARTSFLTGISLTWRAHGDEARLDPHEKTFRADNLLVNEDDLIVTGRLVRQAGASR